MFLVIPLALQVQLLVQARLAYPLEVFGLLAGEQADVAMLIWPLENCAQARDAAFVGEPKDVLKALQAFDRLGVAPIAVYHSHPYGLAIPSSQDREEGWGIPTVIVDVKNDRLRVWKLPDQVEMFLLSERA